MSDLLATLSASEQLALFGCHETLEPRQILQAGPLVLTYQGGRFGPVFVNGHEVWHGVAFLLRDAGWGTPETVVDEAHLCLEAQGFDLQLTAHIPCAATDVLGVWHPDARMNLDMRVKGDALGSVHFSVRATPTHDIQVNRCSWVLLHPLSAAGCAVEVTHVDGRTSHSTFPEEVSAWPPFTNLKTIRHEYAPGCWAQADLPGEDYELEDQRNNADASFKTYGRSNWMPRPFVLSQHQTWCRDVQLRIVDTASPLPPPKAFSGTGCSWPPSPSQAGKFCLQLGLAIAPPTDRPPEAWLLEKLAQWRPAFLHLTLWQTTEWDTVDWFQVRLLLNAAQAKLRLDMCGRNSPNLDWNSEDEASAHALEKALAKAGVIPASVAALPCGERAAKVLRTLFPAAAIGGGTPHFFAQLNRLEQRGNEDFMAFTVCPIVHSADDDDVMHGLQSLPSMLATARGRHPGCDWHLGPSGLGARASPLGRQPFSDGQKRRPLAMRDPRSRGLFGAAWLLGHMAGAAQSEVNALTLPALSGVNALGWPAGDVLKTTPSAALLEVCMQWQGVQSVVVNPVENSGNRLLNWPFAAIRGLGLSGEQILLANLTDQTQSLEWKLAGKWARMDTQSWLRHEDSPGIAPWMYSGDCPAQLELNPYAVALIDLPNQTKY